MYSINQIAQITNAKIVGVKDGIIANILTDSRQLTNIENTLFIAIATKRNDAHRFISHLHETGIRLFLVNEIPVDCKSFEVDSCFLVVDDTLKALQKIATHHREQFDIPVIGITGSNGKTIVKEWLYQLLKSDYVICRSPKSYNSQIGVPLSVWQLNKTHTMGLFEAGISQKEEMKELEPIIHPTIGILTSIGTAHDEGFSGIEEKLNEKLQLFNHCKQLVVNALSFDENLLQGFNRHYFLISKSPQAQLQIIDIENLFTHTIVIAKYQNHQIEINIPFTDTASVENAITCWATLLLLNIPQLEIQKRFSALQPVAMRLELKLGNNNCVLINDFYNSDINALEIALHHQKQQYRGGKKVVVLSDIEQSGKLSWELYKQVALLLEQFQIDILIGIGKEITEQKKQFKQVAYFFETTAEFLKEQKANPVFQFRDSIILLKGARRFEFENISKQLQQKSHDTVLEINLNKLVHNINFYRSQLKPDTKLMCMVKAMGYGSGSSEIAFTLQHHRVDFLAVAYTDEGVDLRKAGIHLPIMVMSPEESSYDDLIEYKLEPEIYSFKVFNEFLKAIQNHAVSVPYPIHLKLDTGMHRLGFENKDIQQLCELLQNEKAVVVKSVFSHLVGSDSEQFDEFTQLQIALFEKSATKIEVAIGYDVIKHICNSGAITRFKNAHYNMVRLGIGMYGVGFNDIEKQNLENISVLKTKISQLKQLESGDTVGYNRVGVVTKPTTIATIPIGYADGFHRILGNGKGVVYIKNTACSIIGNVCMDMCMVDVTHVSCKEGDEVIVFETNEQLMNLSKAMNTIPYEVLTGISERVKRVYVQD